MPYKSKKGRVMKGGRRRTVKKRKPKKQTGLGRKRKPRRQTGGKKRKLFFWT